MSVSARRRHGLAVAAVACVAFAGWMAWRLDSYGVPLGLTIAASCGVLAGVFGAVADLARATATVTHQCPESGCDFRVSLTGTDAAESRRWQEIAANHPHHI